MAGLTRTGASSTVTTNAFDNRSATPSDTIVYFDFSNLHFTGFYLNGLAESQTRLGYRFSVSRRPPAALSAALADKAWQALRFSMGVFEARVGDRKQRFCVDAHDANRLDHPAARFGYHYPLLEAVDHYFKVNFAPEAIQEDPLLIKHRHKIVPITPFIPIQPRPRMPYTPRLLPSVGDGWRVNDCRRRLRVLRTPMSIAGVQQRRSAVKDLDLFFVTSFRRGDRHAAATAMRCTLLEGLAKVPLNSALMGFADARPLPSAAEAFRVPRLKLRDYLDELGRALIVIYTRGLHDCLSSKLSLALGAGAALVGQPASNQLDLFGPGSSVTEQLAFETPDAIVERVRDLIARPQDVARLGRGNAEFFDAHLTPSNAADCMLATLRDQTRKPRIA